MTAELQRLFPKLCKPRKHHKCRLCGGIIAAGENCCRWSGVQSGEGWFTSHAHPECYQVTLDDKWDEGDWESCLPGDVWRPKVIIT